MVETVGYVQSIEWSGGSAPAACVRIGPLPSDVEALTLRLDGTDAQVALRGSLAGALARAWLSGLQVTAVHGDTDGILIDLTVGP